MYPDDFPPALRDLLEALKAAIAALFIILLYEGLSYLETWRLEMTALLSRYHIASYMLGTGNPDLTQVDWDIIEKYYTAQEFYLNNFATEMLTAGVILATLQARAVMYAGAITAPYWSGFTFGLNLPAQPGEGSECMGNCRCMWDIKTLDAASGNYDAYWSLEGDNPDGRNCQTCLGRSRDWSPLVIRGGVY